MDATDDRKVCQTLHGDQMSEVMRLIDTVMCNCVRRFGLDDTEASRALVRLWDGPSSLRAWKPDDDYEQRLLAAVHSWKRPIKNSQVHDALLLHFASVCLVDSSHPLTAISSAAGLGGSTLPQPRSSVSELLVATKACVFQQFRAIGMHAKNVMVPYTPPH